jgi:UrcA family protein
MVMCSNKLSAVQCGRNLSIFNAQSPEESIVSITKLVRTSAIRIAWVMFSFAPIAMIASATQAAEPANAPPHKVVSFRDLNLNTAEGAAVLYKRIKSAAIEVCGVSDSFDLARMYVPRTCMSEAVSRAVAQVDRPMLTSLHQAKTGKANKPVTTLAKTQ